LALAYFHFLSFLMTILARICLDFKFGCYSWSGRLPDPSGGGCQGPDRADFDAFKAPGAAGLGQGAVIKRGDASLEPPLGELEDSQSCLLLANPDAAAAEQAFVGIEEEKGVAAVDGEIVNQRTEAVGLEFEPEIAGNFL